jgi:hypothetical protein
MVLSIFNSFTLFIISSMSNRGSGIGLRQTPDAPLKSNGFNAVSGSTYEAITFAFLMRTSTDNAPLEKAAPADGFYVSTLCHHY